MRWSALVVLISLRAWAAFDVTWDTPANCTARPAPEEMSADANGSAEVIVRSLNDGWQVTVMFFEPVAALRRVKAASCEDAIQTAALLLHLGSRGTLPEQHAVVVATPVVEAHVEAPPPERWHLSAGAGAAFDVGSLTQIDSRIALTVAASRESFRVVLDARFGFERPLVGTATVQRLGELQLATCYQIGSNRFTLASCAAAAGGSWRATTPRGSGDAFVLSAGPQMRAALRIVGGLELAAVAGVRFNIRRPAPFDTGGPFFITPLVASDFQLTLGWRW